jgi:pullulanase/glycogen debranching enzyme
VWAANCRDRLSLATAVFSHIAGKPGMRVWEGKPYPLGPTWDGQGEGIEDIGWFDPLGQEMTDAQWHRDDVRSLAIRLAGNTAETDQYGEPLCGDDLLLLINGEDRSR